MTYALQRLAPVDGEAILSLADVKVHLRVTHESEDLLIGQYRNAAIAHVERMASTALAPTDYRWSCPAFATPFRLPMRPVTDVVEVAYRDADDVVTLYADYRLMSGQVYPALDGNWPTATGEIEVTFTAGLTDPNEAPDLLAAVTLLIGHWYHNREAVTVGSAAKEMPLAVSAMIDSYRMMAV